MRKTRRTLAAALAAAAVAGLTAGPASAALTDTQIVNGVPLSTLAIGVPAPSPFAFTSFGPGIAATGVGTVAVTSTKSWSLSVADKDTTTAHTAGHMYKGGALCPAGAEAETKNSLTILSAGTAALGTAGAGQKTITGTDQVLATGAVTDVVSNTIGMTVGSTEPMGTGCTYATTLTYTVQ
jgi:hypothetical protein